MISGISLWVTLSTSQFKNIPKSLSPYFQFAMYLIAAAVFIIGTYNLYNSFRSRRVIQNIYDGILELEVGRVHTVNIVLLKNAPQKGKYLLVKNKAWRCELFHSYNALSGQYNQSKELENVKSSFARDIGIDPQFLQLTHLGSMPEHTKICAGTNTPYRYVFHFYRVEVKTTEVRLNRSFHYNGNKYVWRSLNQMLKNKNTMKKNADVVNFVAELDNIPYN